MTKMPYEWVQPKVWQLCSQLGEVKDTHQQYAYMDVINDWLQSCGWTEREFDQETLRRIDRAW